MIIMSQRLDTLSSYYKPSYEREGIEFSSLNSDVNFSILLFISIFVPLLLLLCISCQVHQIIQNTRQVKGRDEVNKAAVCRKSTISSIWPGWDTYSTGGKYKGTILDKSQNHDVDVEIIFDLIQATNSQVSGYEIRGSIIKENHEFEIDHGFLNKAGYVYWFHYEHSRNLNCFTGSLLYGVVTCCGCGVTTKEAQHVIVETKGIFDNHGRYFTGTSSDSNGRVYEINLTKQVIKKT